MKRRHFIALGTTAASGLALVPSALAAESSSGKAAATNPGSKALRLENEHFSLALDRRSGALTSLVVKRNQSELIAEKRLAANFRLCLPLPDYLCNYIDGMAQQPASAEQTPDGFAVSFSELRSEKGTFPLELAYTIKLSGDEVRFHARLTNKSKYPVSEFWFPRLGGWTQFNGRDARMTVPGYTSCRNQTALFRGFPGNRGLGNEAAEWNMDYPGMVMPWVDVHDAKTDTGLYLGYHDRVFRLSTWHTYLFPGNSGTPGDAWLTSEQACGEPVGLVFSHVRYPFIRAGETFDSGEFILRVHEGDWHKGSKFYRRWFLENFPFDKSNSWLRKQSAWFSSIIYQPEDRLIADYKTYDQWCQDAEQFGINCHELIGWHHGGLERNYPDYFPEDKLGGIEGYRLLLQSIKGRGKRCLSFVNYAVLDAATEEYRKKLKPLTQQDQFGNPNRWMAWGESTLLARKNLSVHRHVMASVTPQLKKILEGYFLERVKDGAEGFQIDKLIVGSTLDFNPLNTRKPDEALCEGLAEAIAELLAKCRRLNPEFCLASECGPDRMLPYIDVYYRSCGGTEISTLRYVFPEWTAVQHVSAPRDFRGVNGAVLTGAVICVEPDAYRNTLADPKYQELGRYIREVERLRHELADLIFLGNYFDNTEASVAESPTAPGTLLFAVHGHRQTNQRAIVVVNTSDRQLKYAWKFTHKDVTQARLYAPFEAPKLLSSAATVEIKPLGLHILVEGVANPQ
jgi:hypothetical protein